MFAFKYILQLKLYFFHKLVVTTDLVETCLITNRFFLMWFIKHTPLSTVVLHALSNNICIQYYFIDCSYGYYYCL